MTTKETPTVTTLAVEIHALRVGGRSMTKAVYRQLVRDDDLELASSWGSVNDEPEAWERRRHVVWQKGDELRVAIVTAPPPRFTGIYGHRWGAASIAATNLIEAARSELHLGSFGAGRNGLGRRVAVRVRLADGERLLEFARTVDSDNGPMRSAYGFQATVWGDATELERREALEGVYSLSVQADELEQYHPELVAAWRSAYDRDLAARIVLDGERGEHVELWRSVVALPQLFVAT